MQIRCCYSHQGHTVAQTQGGETLTQDGIKPKTLGIEGRVISKSEALLTMKLREKYTGEYVVALSQLAARNVLISYLLAHRMSKHLRDGFRSPGTRIAASQFQFDNPAIPHGRAPQRSAMKGPQLKLQVRARAVRLLKSHIMLPVGYGVPWNRPALYGQC